MANRIDYKSVDFPVVVYERLKASRLHHRQALWELVESTLDFWDDHHGWDPGTRPSHP